MCKVNDDANDVSATYFDLEFKNLVADNEISKVLEKEMGDDDDGSEDDDDAA